MNFQYSYPERLKGGRSSDRGAAECRSSRSPMVGVTFCLLAKLPTPTSPSSGNRLSSLPKNVVLVNEDLPPFSSRREQQEEEEEEEEEDLSILSSSSLSLSLSPSPPPLLLRMENNPLAVARRPARPRRRHGKTKEQGQERRGGRCRRLCRWHGQEREVRGGFGGGSGDEGRALLLQSEDKESDHRPAQPESEDDDEGPTTATRRRRRHSSSPDKAKSLDLLQEKKKQKHHPTSMNDQRSASSSSLVLWETLWHKKTNGGYRLFVNYYAGQPGGVVVAADHRANVGGGGEVDVHDDVGMSHQRDGEPGSVSATTTTSTTEEPHGPKRRRPGCQSTREGMSRASLKRRRRRNNNKKQNGILATTRDGTMPGEESHLHAASSSMLTTATTHVDTLEPVHLTSTYGPPGTRTTNATTRHSLSTALREKNQNAEVDHPLLVAFQDVVASRPLEFKKSSMGGLNSFFASMSMPLPVSFRIRHDTLDDRQRSVLVEELDPFVSKGNVPENSKDGRWLLREVRGLDPGRVYQTVPLLSTSQSTSSSPPIPLLTKSNLGTTAPKFKHWLNTWSGNGGLARQEVGSMLPVVLLQRAGHLPCAESLSDSNHGKHDSLRVLDLCASPGSKTMQVAELLLMLRRHRFSDRRRTFTLRANDVHPQRLQALQDAVSRSGISDIDSVIKYSQLDAAQFPVPSDARKLYDVVICDVPCSGDGTCRKDRHVLPNWTPRIGNALHGTQLAILVRAMRLVKPGGVVSYSTCSLNPVENEAVVAAALSSSRGDRDDVRFQLIPVPGLLPDFVLRPGVATWRVADMVASHESRESSESESDEVPVLRWHDGYEGAVKAGMDGAAPTLWPSDSGPVKVTQHLDRCGRLWPQDQDTGGFFVALLQRIS